MRTRHILAAGFFGCLLGLAFILTAAFVDGCYAHTPAPSCAQDPGAPGCYGGLTDRLTDGGR
jgi:hypothetical protein